MQKTSILLVIDTEQYSGNFEREMTGWIVGNNNHGEMYDRDMYLKTHSAYPELEDYFSEWQTEYCGSYIFDEEYGRQMCGIVVTPGWSNDGYGQHSKLPEGTKRKWPAYQSVGIAIRKTLPDDMIDIVKQLAHEFANNYNITITGLRYVTETVTTNTTEEEIK